MQIERIMQGTGLSCSWVWNLAPTLIKYKLAN